MTSHSNRDSNRVPGHSHLTEFDWLIEQQDQELAQDEVSPFTQTQLQAHASGQPIPHVDLNSPQMQEVTAHLRASVRRYRQSLAHPSPSIEGESSWSGYDYDDE